ncbi:MAG: precorrin-6Y C5,15-methyltransferase (decarboxylating) subunit CbiT [Nitrosopumilaceae archaeon]|nr:precorrin-6Y C5,15-methyltransferase (decarboxylating) subunit CbiT [Nitrosopumilaceae archaeon]
MWQYKTPGIPDENFLREAHIPITKEEIRAIQISKARICPGYVIYDIGCGSGSLSVEAALQVGQAGKVYSIDVNLDAINLTRKNLSKFSITNTSVIHGNAKDKLFDLPTSDVIFIGGTGIDTTKIIEICYMKLKQGGRIVMGIILLETLFNALNTINRLFTSIDITQVIISKNRQLSIGTMMLSRNPITIISASKSRF